MAQAISITGGREVIHSLNRIKRNFPAFLIHTTNKYTEKVVVVAKEKCGVETGALQSSVGRRLARKVQNTISAQIFVGNEAIVRGEGKYKIIRQGPSAGKPASRKPTSEYAQAHDEYSKFMKNAVDWGDTKARKAVEDAINKAFRSF